MAILSVPVMAQGQSGSGSVDILGTGIYETTGAAFKFPYFANTNLDLLSVGNDKALAIGSIWQTTPMTIATNNLEIKKNQDSGCDCCQRRFTCQTAASRLIWSRSSGNRRPWCSNALATNVKITLTITKARRPDYFMNKCTTHGLRR
jgi:hypothetical protein